MALTVLYVAVPVLYVALTVLRVAVTGRTIPRGAPSPPRARRRLLRQLEAPCPLPADRRLVRP